MLDFSPMQTSRIHRNASVQPRNRRRVPPRAYGTNQAIKLDPNPNPGRHLFILPSHQIPFKPLRLLFLAQHFAYLDCQ